jgi:DNA repair exonuclease SbcCD ATPase subunit
MSTIGEPDPDLITITDPAAPAPPPAPRRTPAKSVFTAEDIERARQEEKDKVYGRLTKAEEALQRMETERQAFEQERAEAEKARKQAEKEAEKVRKLAEDEDKSAKQLLAEAQADWEFKLQEERSNRERLEAILLKERESQDLQMYLSQQMVAVAEGTDEYPDGIVPQMRRFVAGNSKEEIDASIRAAQEATAELLGEIRSRSNGQRAQQPTSRVTSPPVGPMELTETGVRQLSAQDIKDMTPAEYAAIAPQLREAASRMYHGR